jgi:chaperonin GroES
LAKKSSKSKSAAKSVSKPSQKKGQKKGQKKTALTAKPAGKSKAATKASAKVLPKSSSKPSPKKVAAKVATKKIVKSMTKAANKSAAKTAAKPTMKAKASASAGKEAAPAPAKKFEGQKSTGTFSLSGHFSPLDDRIIIEEFKQETHTPGGLIIPDTVGASEGPRHGKVLAVGRGHRDKKGRIRPLDVKLGDTVLFEPYMGSPLTFGERDCVVLRESQLLGVVNS